MHNLHKVIVIFAVVTFGLTLMFTTVHASANDKVASATVTKNKKSYYSADSANGGDTIESRDDQGNPEGKASDNSGNSKDSRGKQEFWIHAWDKNKKHIPTTTTNNALHVATNFTYEKMDNIVPYMNPVWGNYTHDSDGNNNYASVNNQGTKPVSFKTKWMLPRGFNINKTEHGNYQGMVMANNSIYMVESLGTGANQGAIIRFNMDSLKKMGLDKADNQQLLVKAFSRFSPFNRHGQKRMLGLVKYLNQNGPLVKKINNQKKLISIHKKQISIAKNKISNGFKAYRKAIKRVRHAKRRVKKDVQKRQKRIYNAIKRKQNHIIKHHNSRMKSINKGMTKINKKINRLSHNKNMYYAYYQLSKSITATPLINIGHGQTLAYNPKNKHLYLAQDTQLTRVDNNYYNQVTEINPQTMMPVHQYRFKLIHNGVNHALHTLTFDNNGNAYFGVHAGPGGLKNVYSLYTGTLKKSGVRFRPIRQMINWPGSYNQYLAYNRSNDRIYMISNDMIISVPSKKLRDNSLGNDDVHYLTYNTNREFESLAFDSKGYGYLLTLWKSELLHSNVPMD